VIPVDNATRVVEAGSAVIDKQARDGSHSRPACERLVYCLWLADYSMRNAGVARNLVVALCAGATDARSSRRRLSNFWA
jgi:hypothetical protein